MKKVIRRPPIGQIKSKISISRRDKRKQVHRDVLFIDCVPRSTKGRFKAACAEKGESMRDAVIRLLRYYVINEGILPGLDDE